MRGLTTQERDLLIDCSGTPDHDSELSDGEQDLAEALQQRGLLIDHEELDPTGEWVHYFFMTNSLGRLALQLDEAARSISVLT